MLLAVDGAAGKIDVKPAAPSPAPKPAATIPYNPAGYVPGGASPKVAKAIETKAIAEPGLTPVQVPATIEKALPHPPVNEPQPTIPTPAAQPPAPLPAGNLNHSELEQLWLQAGGTPETADVAAAVAQAESGGDRTALDNTAYPDRPQYHKPGKGASPEFSRGLWQINELAHPTYSDAELQVPLLNAKAALAISDRGTNFDAWSTFTSGAYKAHLQGSVPKTLDKGGPAVTVAATTVKAPAKVQTAWGNVIDFFAKTVPERHGAIQSVSDSFIGVLK